MLAAAAAGYLAKNWPNIFRDRKSGFPSGSSVPYNPLSQSLIRQQSENSNENRLDGTFTEKSRRDGPTTVEVACTSTWHHGKQVDRLKDDNMPSSSVFPPEFRKYENYEYESSYRLGSDLSDIPENHVWNTGPSHSPRRSRNSWRSKRLHLQFIKPRSCLDSCLVAQMYRGHAEMEDYVLSPLASPCPPTLRPFLVTDGRRLIGRASGDFRDGLHVEGHLKASDGVVGVPCLPRIQDTDDSKQRLDKSKKRTDKTSYDSSLMQFDPQDGAPSGQFLFYLGISIGIMYNIIAQKLEIEKLKESLNQSENLVQDLQEELEMKDSLIVKELVIDDSSQDAHETSLIGKELNMFSSEADADLLMRCANDESANPKEVKSMSKIEAELEAELERLELSMNGTTMHGKLSGAIELEREFDEDIIADLVQGELRADVRRKSSSEPTPDQGFTPLSAKYGVSPRELSLRLHEVIQTRLQERIKELEAELSRTQKRVQHLESEKVISWRDFWNSESSSNPSTPIVVEAHSPLTQPVVMNLSGDALDAYSEACEELSKIKVSQNEEPIQANGLEDNQLATHQVSNGWQNGNQDFDVTTKGEGGMPTGRVSISFDEGSPNVDEGSPDHKDDSDDHDNDDLLLIKQIVEKARQGSPAILRAQRALVYPERRE